MVLLGLSLLLCWSCKVGGETANLNSNENFKVGNTTFEEWNRRRGLSQNEFDRLLQLSKDVHRLLAKRSAFEYDESQVDEFVGGMLYTPETLELWKAELEEELGLTSGRTKRQLKSSYNMFGWQSPIKYAFDGTQKAKDKVMIKAAIDAWEELTCIRFEEVDKEGFNTNGILFTTNKGRYDCWSVLGKSYSRPQQLNLKSYKCTYYYTVPAHELAHALGLHHHHQRDDRDDYIEVVNDNIHPSYRTHFSKRSTSLLFDVKYDYGSVVHYGGVYVALDPSKYSIKTKNPWYQGTIGQNAAISFGDAHIINAAYCSDVCETKLDCQNGGYTDPNDCSKCRCPEGLGGTLCTEPELGQGDCSVIYPHETIEVNSDVVTVGSEEICITSDNYGKAYGVGSNCHYMLKTHEDCPTSTIKAYFKDDFGLFCSSSDNIIDEGCRHWVELKYHADLGMRGPRFCCKSQIEGVTVVSESNTMVVSFDARYPKSFPGYVSPPSSSRRTPGFKLCFKASDDCTATVAPQPCESQPCKNGAICHNDGDSYYCDCSEGFRGSNCEDPIRIPESLDVSEGKDDCDTPWGEWGVCSIPCGGCGISTRKRTCSGVLQVEEKFCNVKKCPWKLRKKVKRCCFNWKKNKVIPPPGKKCSLVDGIKSKKDS